MLICLIVIGVIVLVGLAVIIGILRRMNYRSEKKHILFTRLLDQAKTNNDLLENMSRDIQSIHDEVLSHVRFIPKTEK